jgi:hypothetical protein
MADKKNDIDEVHVLPVVQTTTSVTPSMDDQEHAIHGDAKENDPPVRTGRPDVPIAQTMTEGTGAHTPPDPTVFGPDGRLKDEALAKAEKNVLKAPAADKNP